MPGGDRTGPAGLGPMTGRGAGYCAGYNAPGYASGSGRGLGRGRGFFGRGGGRGWRHWFHATGLPRWLRPGIGPTAVDRTRELADLKRQADFLQSGLGEINQRMEQLEKEGT